MPKDAWVLLATAVGALSSLAGTWLNAWLNRRNQLHQSDRAAIKLLRALLKQGPRWRTTWAFSTLIGSTSREKTVELLLLSGARGSVKHADFWGSCSRNPLSKSEQDDPDGNGSTPGLGAIA